VSDGNCSDALALISAYRDFLTASGNDITPRLIAWGLKAIEREKGSAGFARRGWEEMGQEERWRRVRLFMSANALNVLAGVLEREYGEPATQLSLLGGNHGQKTQVE
jgi:hypothetical protein